MKEIKIFLASSEELKEERLVITEMEMMLNNVLRKWNVQIDVEKWEHLDSSMGIKHKQEEYNDVLEECDMCIALFWTRFGDYTKTEFELAYERMEQGESPNNVVVYFKNSNNITPELQEFKDNFTRKYNVETSRFSNIDTLKSYFVSEMIDLCDIEELECENIDGWLTINGVKFANLNNIKIK